MTSILTLTSDALWIARQYLALFLLTCFGILGKFCIIVSISLYKWLLFACYSSVTKQRTEIILQGTYDNPIDAKARWEEYEFHCKPGNVTRRPCLISPYHYRLDWLMWFAAFQVRSLRLLSQKYLGWGV